jgi:hypothetical protein
MNGNIYIYKIRFQGTLPLALSTRKLRILRLKQMMSLSAQSTQSSQDLLQRPVNPNKLVSVSQWPSDASFLQQQQ